VKLVSLTNTYTR